MEEIIRKIYLEIKDNPAAFSGVENVYKRAKKLDKNITREDVEKVLEGEKTYTLHKPRRITRFPRLRTLASWINSDWQCDLADFQKIKRKNGNYAWLLVCIDILSRKIYAVPIKTKETKSVKAGFEKIFQQAIPSRLTSDEGKEFEAPSMKTYFGEKGIEKRTIQTPNVHAGVVERANRTIKSRLYKYFTQFKTNKWVDVIDQIIENINNSVNRGIGIAPNKVTEENANEIYKKYFKPTYIPKKSKFKVGDIVRATKTKGTFEKSYLPNYTEELFRIVEVKKSNPIYYKLETLDGTEILGPFYPQELAKATIEPNQRISEILEERVDRRGQKEYKVHWIGEPSSHDQWVKANERFRVV